VKPNRGRELLPCRVARGQPATLPFPRRARMHEYQRIVELDPAISELLISSP